MGKPQRRFGKEFEAEAVDATAHAVEVLKTFRGIERP